MSRRLVAAVVAAAVLGAIVAGSLLQLTSAPRPPVSSRSLPPATAPVTRTTLVETKTVAGTLGYGEAVALSAIGTGTITWIAPVGTTVKRGEPLFKVDERPVVALYGAVPMYRTLRVTASSTMQGADVKQLQENLTELGYRGSDVDGSYAATTAEAVRRWQADLGLPQTGTVEFGQVVFTPGPVRIAGHRARTGDILSERGAPILSYTGTTRLVTVQLDVADQALAVEGRTVMLKVPGRKGVEGMISRVGAVITAQESAAQTAATRGPARLEVTVTIRDEEGLGRLDAAPVDVDFVSEERKGVLTVPVAALLALSGGGFGVEVVDGDTTHVIPVQTGLFAAGRVEVSGEGIAEGVTVGMPK
jgi:multidrug efflux system membrane fusion protein